MNRWTRKIRWIVALSMMVVLLASTTVVYGGLRWTGIDPELDINGHKVNVSVFWPQEYTCDVFRYVKFKVQVPAGAVVSFDESEGTFKCDNGFTNTIETETHVVKRGKRNVVKVTGYVGGLSRFPIKVVVQSDDERRVCRGTTNRPIRCRAMPLN